MVNQLPKKIKDRLNFKLQIKKAANIVFKNMNPGEVGLESDSEHKNQEEEK